MSERITAGFGYTAPDRIRETVEIDDTVSHIDILLPYARDSFEDNMRWVHALTRVLRIHRIDERSLVLSDLSALPDNHSDALPPTGAELDAPYTVMDIYDNEAAIYGRDHNPAQLAILANRHVSREHITITPHLGESGLSLSFLDTKSTNGSGLVVARHNTIATTPDPFESLFVA